MRLASTIIVSACLMLGWGCGQHKKEPLQQSAQVIVDGEDPQLTNDWIGSQACAECHEDIADAYQRHSMGRSAQLLTEMVELPRLERATFDAGRFRYAVQKRNGQWLHHQGRITDGGEETAEIDAVVRHVIGSGAHGQSYLVDHGGYLFMSPITWYPDKQIWDLSPGYEKSNSQFNRPVVELCLYCHSNGSPAAADQLNHYNPPFVRGHAIGCERCHGPGRAHVAKQTVSATSGGHDPTIVNPARLQHDLRDAVCNQCHLSGSMRVTKPGKTLYDFRPGNPLESAYTVFIAERGDRDSRFVGHVEQMQESSCFQSSGGQLGCISCHDPHRLPSSEMRTQYYRDRCLTCHETKPCTESDAARTPVSDNCITCHMPPLATEVRHAAVTDHSIPRSPKARTAGPSASTVFFAFPSDQKAKPTARDRAIAMERLQSREADLFTPGQLAQARRWLEDETRTNPLDFDALDALANLRLMDGDSQGAISACLQTLSRAPRRETTLTILAETYSGVNRFGQAIPIWKQARQVNPWIAKYWYRLGQAYAATGQWFVCRQTAIEAKVRFPTSIGVRHLLIQSNLQLGDADAAQKEYQELERFDPPGMTSIRSWYQEQAPIPP